MCGSVFLGLNKGRMVTVIAARRCMHVWECVSRMHKAHGHCDCFEAMYACVRVCVWSCKGAWSL
jgi:hypothetical protein